MIVKVVEVRAMRWSSVLSRQRATLPSHETLGHRGRHRNMLPCCAFASTLPAIHHQHE
jgi:hypothetical protein